jgi:hypothetical protein
MEEIRFNLNPKVRNLKAEIREIDGDQWLCLDGDEEDFRDIWASLGEMFDLREEDDD